MRFLIQTFSLLLFIALSNISLAAGFGQSQIHSTLGEPLQLTLPILNVSEFSDENLRFSIASEESYKNMGVEFHYSHFDLDMTIERGEDGNVHLVISSKRPIKEPVIDFVLQLQSPEGKYMKEVIAFLELPQH